MGLCICDGSSKVNNMGWCHKWRMIVQPGYEMRPLCLKVHRVNSGYCCYERWQWHSTLGFSGGVLSFFLNNKGQVVSHSIYITEWMKDVKLLSPEGFFKETHQKSVLVSELHLCIYSKNKQTNVLKFLICNLNVVLTKMRFLAANIASSHFIHTTSLSCCKLIMFWLISNCLLCFSRVWNALFLLWFRLLVCSNFYHCKWGERVWGWARRMNTWVSGVIKRLKY